MLPTVDFCGLKMTRLLIGANPFGGFSHQTSERDQAMVSYHTVDRILETWQRAEAAGINTMVTNTETPHVIEAVEKYISGGGKLQWIAQIGAHDGNMPAAIDKAVKIGAKAFYFWGGHTDHFYAQRDEKTFRAWVDHAHKSGVPMGVAGHSPEAHYWVNGLNIVDFHVVCFFNCGSVHHREGHRFHLTDAIAAAECARRIRKPCIGYKIMGAGRIDPTMAFEFAFDNLKPTDVVNVGMHRGDKDNMIEENVATVRRILGC
ncbi:MAG: hypothetical protein NTV86_03435 [Planctomycetota bacterium]|nr:hypothetical protein [Planctomycetota bacterium]